MSTGATLPFDYALRLAKRVSDELESVVKRSKVAGSLRRRREEVGDLELVVEPLSLQEDLLGESTPDTEAVLQVAQSWGEIVKAGDRYIQVTHLFGVEDFNCELYLVHPPAQWGSILAIRTGPKELSRFVVFRMQGRGLRHVKGRVIRLETGETVPTPTEEAFFDCAGLPCLPPARRDQAEAFQPVEGPTASTAPRR